MMKRSILATLATAFFATAGASFALKAADMAYKAAPLPTAAPVYSWTGFYMGVQAGGQFSAFPLSGATSGTVTATPGFGDPGVIGPSAAGFTGGLHAGFNYRFAPLMVFGLEADASASSINSNSSATGSALFMPFTVTSAASIPWKAEVLTKIGVLVLPDVLFYGVGGASFAELKQNSNLQSLLLPGGINGAFDNVHAGWAGGAGVDWAINPHVILGFRYLYENWGTKGVILADPAITSAYNATMKAATNEFTGRISFAF